MVEDILRYEFDSPLSKKLKELRHVKIPNYENVVIHRDSLNDVLKPSTKSELLRNSLFDIVISNLKRSQESARVLEEIFKLLDTDISEKFKNARYTLYEIEKETIKLLKDKNGKR